MAQVINREEFKSVATQDFGEISSTMTASGVTCYVGDDSALIPEDLEAASQVLDGVTIRIVGPQIIGTNGSGNAYIQERLRAAGAEVELANVDVGTWISTVFGEPSAWDMTAYAELNFSGSLETSVGAFVGEEPAEGGYNLGNTQSPEANAAFDASRAAETEEEYCGHMNDALSAIIEGAHGVPLMNEDFLYVQRAGFEVTMPGGTLDDHVFRILD